MNAPMYSKLLTLDRLESTCTKAVCIAELGVNKAEKSAMTPILETIVLKSAGRDGLPDDVSTRLDILFRDFDAVFR